MLAPSVAHRIAIPGWDVHVRAEQGSRPSMQDAWAVVPNLRLRGRTLHALAVFDGVGGHPRGDVAAETAARGLREAVLHAASAPDALARLNRAVLPTGGATTVVILLLPADGGPAHWLSAGDSIGMTLERAGPMPATPMDSAGRDRITAFLGLADLQGHASEVSPLPPSFLLATDGVHRYVPADLLAAAMEDPASGVDAVMEAVVTAGSPDNATVIVARATLPISTRPY